jgi:hypothetical protein
VRNRFKAAWIEALFQTHVSHTLCPSKKQQRCVVLQYDQASREAPVVRGSLDVTDERSSAERDLEITAGELLRIKVKVKTATSAWRIEIVD